MNIPNLPTDNFYKFFALSGVLISIVCLVIPSVTRKQIGDELIAIEAEVEELKEEAEILFKKRERLDKEITRVEESLAKYEMGGDSVKPKVILSDFYEKLKNPEFRDYAKFAYDYDDKIFPEAKLHEILNEKNEALNEISDEISLKSKRSENKLKAINYKERGLDATLRLCYVGLAIGMILMYFGFHNWYFKVQIYLDEKIMNDSRLATRRRAPSKVSFIKTKLQNQVKSKKRK